MGPQDNPGKVRGFQFGLRRVKGFGASGGFDSGLESFPTWSHRL